MELDEYFCFYAPNFRFHPKFKSRMWDGRIHIFHTKNNTIYAGLIEYIYKFAEDRGYSIISAFEPDEIKITSDDIKQFVDTLKISSNNVDIDTRDYQLSAIETCVRHKRQIILSATSSGKSLVIYVLMRYLQTITDKKLLLIVPTVGLVTQMYNDFVDYSTNTDWCVEDNCHQISSGKEKNAPQQIIISTWQSIFRMPKSYFAQFDGIIVDEVHNATASSIKNIMEKSVDVSWRIGFTGTLRETKAHHLVLEGLFGKATKVVSTKELMDRNQVAKLNIKCVVLDYGNTLSKACKSLPYAKEVDFVVGDKKRMDFIVNLAKHLKGNTLILFKLVEKHGKPLFTRLSNELPDRPIYYVTGAVNSENRETIRTAMETHNDAILVASLGTMSTGVSIKKIHNIIFASPSKSKITVLQSIGRGLRMANDKNKVALFDIVDDLRYKSHTNYVFKHFLERVRYYGDEKFDFDITTYTLYKEKTLV